jgi:hypothetical protein
VVQWAVGRKEARADPPEFADVSLPVAVLADGRDSGHRVLAPHLGADAVLYPVHRQLHLDLRAHRALQGAALDDPA